MNKYWLMLFAAVVISTVSQVLLKRGTQRKRNTFWDDYLNPWVIAGYVLMVISTICVIFAYRGVDYKNGPVVESLGFIFVLFLGRVFFGERLTAKKIIGTLVIVAGIIVFYL